MKILKNECKKSEDLMLSSSKTSTPASYGQINMASMSLANNEGLNQNIIKELLRHMVYDFSKIEQGSKWAESIRKDWTLSSYDCDRLINNGDYVSTLPKSFKKPYEDLLKEKESKKKDSKKSAPQKASKKTELDELLSANGLTRDDIKMLKARKAKTAKKKATTKKRV